MSLVSDLQLASTSAGFPIVETGFCEFNFPAPIQNKIGDENPADRTDRVQVQPSYGEHQFLVRHDKLGHFCGYVIVNEERWERMGIANQRVIRDRCKRWSLPVSFCAYNNTVVTWCLPNTRGRLTIPTRVNPNGPDLILGFTTQDIILDGRLLDSSRAMVILHNFARVIREGMDEYSALRR